MYLSHFIVILDKEFNQQFKKKIMREESEDNGWDRVREDQTVLCWLCIFII